MLRMLCACAPLALAGSVLAAPPACQALNQHQPARLNIDSGVERFGMPPCEGHLVLYLWRDAPMHGLEGRLELFDPQGGAIGSLPVNALLDASGGGMRSGAVALGPVDDRFCQRVALHLHVERCVDEAGGSIACPAVRVKAGEPFAGLTISGQELDTCID